MSEIRVSRVIDAPPARVWEVITDVDAAAETLSGVTSVQRMTDGPYAVGFRWQETRTMFGRESTEEMWVSACDPWRRTEVRAESAGARYVTEFVLTPLDEETRTELSVTFGAELLDPTPVRKLLMRAMAPVAVRATRAAIEQDLADIAVTATT